MKKLINIQQIDRRIAAVAIHPVTVSRFISNVFNSDDN